MKNQTAKQTHTPGPWNAGKPTAIHGQSAVYAEADGKDIAIVYDGAANANLIAAAPELLEMLRCAVSELHCVTHLGRTVIDASDEMGWSGLCDLIQNAEAAIRKAEAAQ